MPTAKSMKSSVVATVRPLDRETVKACIEAAKATAVLTTAEESVVHRVIVELEKLL